ncbi:hypothetical protein [Paludisphaera mucosa]|uniref:DUF3828 domain-containing protein n=1 Tax=Paludisphaera mucosa TaxID=3030827 RepID=A0ABT6FIU7_9BACT|nr:hypothetical protein [Paludisphaera mucosa]MDG3007506.1 hypothetical protein [Paludisphaera mucosa]
MLGRDGLVGYVKAHKSLKEKAPAEFVSFNVAEREGLPLAECLFRTADQRAAVKVLLAREGGAWKVERLTAD